MIPKRFCQGATLHVCSVCGKVKRLGEWIEFTLDLQVKAQKRGCTTLEVLCPHCESQKYSVGFESFGTPATIPAPSPL